MHLQDLNSFFNWFCNPVVVFGMLLMASMFFKLIKHNRKSILFLVAGVFWMVLVSTTPLPQWLVYILERQYKPLDVTQQTYQSPVYILILGGGHTNSPELPASMQLSGTAVVRLAEGLRLHALLPGSKLVCSGYSSSKRTTQAEMLANAAIEWGLRSEDTIQMRSPSRTVEEVRAFKERFGLATLIIITSASHMPRVMMICKREGVNAFPAPTDYLLKEDDTKWQFEFYPSTEKLYMMQRALHEYGGIAWLRLLE